MVPIAGASCLAQTAPTRHNARFYLIAGHGWLVDEVKTAPLRDATARSRTAEQAPHVRAHGCASSARPPFCEHRGEFRQHDVAETVTPGAMALVTFPERKVTRSPGGERNQDMDVDFRTGKIKMDSGFCSR
ncbi:MAG: hypothetical protein J0H27_03545 [Xanthomonadales bacterium]|nr:hypothetical protein [Xanthomonadales bacterium]